MKPFKRPKTSIKKVTGDSRDQLQSRFIEEMSLTITPPVQKGMAQMKFWLSEQLMTSVLLFIDHQGDKYCFFHDANNGDMGRAILPGEPDPYSNGICEVLKDMIERLESDWQTDRKTFVEKVVKISTPGTDTTELVWHINVFETFRALPTRTIKMTDGVN